MSNTRSCLPPPPPYFSLSLSLVSCNRSSTSVSCRFLCVGLLSVALVASLLFGAVPAGAQTPSGCETTDIWCATLTAGSAPEDAGWGYSGPDLVSFGELDPSSFTHDGTTFEVTELTSTPSALEIFFRFGVDLAKLESFVLHIGDSSYTLSLSGNRFLSWPVTSAVFSSGNTYTVRLVDPTAVPPPTAPPDTATPADPAVPGPPTGLYLVPGDGQLTAHWSEPGYWGEGGDTIVGYFVSIRSVRTTGDGKRAYNRGHSYGADKTSRTLDGLTNGWTYEVRVSARNSPSSRSSDPTDWVRATAE